MLRVRGISMKITLLVIFFAFSFASKNKYCDVCKNHTMCLYNGLGKKCKDPGDSGVSEQEKIHIVDTHNSMRSRVALGLEGRGKGGPQRKGANMMKLRWDNSLAEVAQKWADQCDFGHDTCRNDPRWQVGQNVFWKNKYPNHKVNWTEAITAWYNEVDLFDPKSVESFIFDGVTGHYTQLMWHNTLFVGCGRRDYGNNKLYVCNYGPAGNWLDEPIYKVGEPCSKCPAKTSCDKGLCSNTVVGNRRTIDTTTAPAGIIDDGNDIIDNETNPKHHFSDYNEIDLDAETLAEVEDIKSQIIRLIKKTGRNLQN